MPTSGQGSNIHACRAGGGSSVIQDSFAGIAPGFIKLGLLAAIKSVCEYYGLKFCCSLRLMRLVAASLLEVTVLHVLNPVFGVTKRSSGERPEHSLTVHPNIEAKLSLLGRRQ